jgi:hypothetical protein
VTTDLDPDVVLGEAGLGRDDEGDFLEAVGVAHLVQEGDEKVEAGLEGSGILANPLDHEG